MLSIKFVGIIIYW